MPVILVLIFIPILFYLLVPAAGAFHVRKVWRKFREKMVDSSFFPISGYNDIISLKREGYYRFFGEIEAIQSEGFIWVRSREITISVKMNHCHVYMIPSEKKMNDQMPVRLPWNRVFSIAEGTALYISGEVKVENGRAAFSGNRQNPLIVIIYDGESRTLLERSISCGRQKNEYWNFLTPWSIAAGGIVSLLLLDMMIKASVSSTVLIIGLIVSLIPVIPFIPPGLLFFLLYLSCWKKGRICRSDRDLLKLPLRFEERNISDPDYLHIHFNSERPLFPLKDGYSVRNIHFEKKNIKKDSLWNNSVFGRIIKEEDGKWITFSEDPMKEYLLILDEPYNLIKQCNKKALFYETYSLFFIIITLSMNVFLLIQIFRMFA